MRQSRLYLEYNVDQCVFVCVLNTVCIVYFVGSMQHCCNCIFFRKVLFLQFCILTIFDPIKHIYIICDNILNELFYLSSNNKLVILSYLISDNSFDATLS